MIVNTDYNLLLGDASPIAIIIAIINWTLGILALIAVILILYGGFSWMFSRGDEAKIEKAKLILRNALIGLVIVLASWGIARYVINLLLDVSGAENNQYATPYNPYEPSGGSPFYVDHTNPADGDTDIPLCHIIAATFSYPLNEPTVTSDSFMVTDPAGNELPGSLAFSDSSYAAVFYPSTDYQPDTVYRVELATTIEGINPETGAVYNLTSGDPKRIFTFTTGDTTDNIPPKVDVTQITPYPGDGEVDVCLNPTLQATFSESLDPASPADENIWLYPAAAVPSDSLDLGPIRLSSIGGEPDDTIVTSPEAQLSSFTEYGLNLYSGDPSTDHFAGAIYDTCGNPLSGDFDDDMEGSPTDDFVDPTSVPAADGFTYQWNFTTGDAPYCLPEIDNITQADTYYSEDQTPLDQTGSEDSGIVLIEGSYLYPFYDVDFSDNVSAAGLNCFDSSFSATMSCFVGNVGSSSISLRTPVASRTGRLSVENGNGADISAEAAIIDSPYIRNTSPLSGPTGQYITIRGSNFIDYNPANPNSAPGQVFFDGVAAEVMCDDGWDDDTIIVRVPEGFNPNDRPLIQVVTTAAKHSNQEAFTVSAGAPGPGLCELQPNCSDTGADNITAIGENFGPAGAVYFDPSDGDYVRGEVAEWNSQTIVTAGTPVTEPDTYNFTAGNSNGISNGLDFNITCNPSPQLFEYYQCDLEADTYYLPNPTAYSDNACVNSVVYYAFTDTMADSTVTANTHVYRCNNAAVFNDTSCTTEVLGSFVSDFLNPDYVPVDDGLYSAYTFYPRGGLSPGYHYKVTLSTDIQNTAGVPLDSDYSWHFQVRNDTANCVADYLSLTPATDRVTSYSRLDACIDHMTSAGTSYSLRARLATADCLVLDDAGNYTWGVNQPAGDNILKFGDNDAVAGDNPGISTSDATTTGYNTVCLQGDDETNDGYATVTASLLDPADSSVAANDSAVVEVDFGFCTQDSDCYTAECRDTYCDPTTSHCAPDITQFSPNHASGADVGPGGCVTLTGCYFGNNQDQIGSCTCTNLEVADTDPTNNETCSVEEGSTTCLLQDSIHTCSLGETYCTLAETCTTESASANYDLDFFRGCDCVMPDTSGRTCRVAAGQTQCVVAGLPTETCTVAHATFVDGGSGVVSFATAAGDYPSTAVCGDTWDNDQVIAQVPNDGSVPAGSYNLTLSSYYNLSDTYDEAECTVGSAATPCLCRLEPNTGREATTTDLYGEGFDILTTDGGEAVTFAGGLGRIASNGSETWVSPNFVNDAVVPDGAVTADDGVQLESNNYSSNALEFTVSCGSNYDCSTGCCSEGQCSAAEVCNVCENSTDCSYGSCASECVNGTCAPYITAVSPDDGAVGQPVTIQGCHFGTYYDPITYTPGSEVRVDGMIAPLACNETDSWNNLQIIATMPEGIFSDDTPDAANVIVTQVSTRDDVQVAQTSNSVTFGRDDSCSAVDLPVLCDVDPAYSPVTAAYAIDLAGEHFRNQNDGYCTCSTDTLGDCTIAEAANACTITTTTSYYVNPDASAETCATTTSNAYTVYDSLNGYCVYTDPSDPTVTCTISVGSASCSLTASETCYADASNPAVTCSPAISNFVNLDGSVEYADDLPASIDWAQYYDEQYITNVPAGAATGDVVAIATTSTGTQCTSNGLEFPVTCSTCGDCASTADNLLNCNLDYDPAFGSCTPDTTGFCRAAPGSCCNVSSCVYDDTNAADGGTCQSQPVLVDVFPTANATNVCSNAQIYLQFSRPITTSTVFNVNDNDETDVDTSNDVASADINFTDYVRLHLAALPDTDPTNEIRDITLSHDGTTLTVTLDHILSFGSAYEIIIDADATVAPGSNHHTGIVDAETGVAVAGELRIPFTTLSSAAYATSCTPTSVTLEANRAAFRDASYTFSESGQTEDFTARVSGASNQPLARIDDGAGAGFHWTYDWDPVYATLDDLEADQCPVAGIITEGASNFVEDTHTQTMTADTPDSNGSNSDTLAVTVTGDGSVEQGWGGALEDHLTYDFYYCDPDYLVSYDNTDYNFYWAYCQGSDTTAEDFLPEFENIFSRNAAAIDAAYGSDQPFIYEAAFKDISAATNDPTTNNNLVAIRVYPNDFDGDLATPDDSVNPDLWYLLNTNNTDSEVTEMTVDGYDAVMVGNTVYVAATNLLTGGSTIYPYIFVIAYSGDATEATSAVVQGILDGFKFNRNTIFADDCAIEQTKLIADTDRVTDLGSLAYVLSSYYYNDADANGVTDFPTLQNGSYITGLTTSLWPSWNEVLGEALGQTLATDPSNTFADAATACPYDPPDLSASETTGTYYDVAGTCWDPVLNDFYGPAGSQVYLYHTSAADDFSLYANLEYSGLGSWIEGSYNPCAAASVNEYSDRGCNTFDYVVEASETTDDATYADLF